MGWNQAHSVQRTAPGAEKLFKGIPEGSYFYFAHSYYCQPKDKEVILTTTNYGIGFASSIHKDNIWAVQFHPEKSQSLGLEVFRNFLNLC
jgi:glutamine amidotransferase